MNKAVREYFIFVPDDRKGIIMKLHEIIVGLYPPAKIDMSYRMPTYKFNSAWVALANQKQYVSLYTCGQKRLWISRKNTRQ